MGEIFIAKQFYSSLECASNSNHTFSGSWIVFGVKVRRFGRLPGVLVQRGAGGVPNESAVPIWNMCMIKIFIGKSFLYSRNNMILSLYNNLKFQNNDLNKNYNIFMKLLIAPEMALSTGFGTFFRLKISIYMKTIYISISKIWNFLSP